jgi:hypothetical protein
VQLPAYLHLYREVLGETPHDAGLILLAEGGRIERLFGPKWTDEDRADVVETMIPQLIQTLARHMLDADEFSAQPGRRCEWCEFRAPCGR